MAAKYEPDTGCLAIKEIEALNNELAIAADDQPVAALESDRECISGFVGHGLECAGVYEQTLNFEVSVNAKWCRTPYACVSYEPAGWQ